MRSKAYISRGKKISARTQTKSDDHLLPIFVCSIESYMLFFPSFPLLILDFATASFPESTNVLWFIWCATHRKVNKSFKGKSCPIVVHCR